MNQVVTGILFAIFGLLVGGIGVASAGFGVGIPMIPLGIYLIVRGFRAFSHQKEMEETSVYEPQRPFEGTRFGRFLLGILLILFGIATSALLVGIPVIIAGVILIASGFRSGKKEEFPSPAAINHDYEDRKPAPKSLAAEKPEPVHEVAFEKKSGPSSAHTSTFLWIITVIAASAISAVISAVYSPAKLSVPRPPPAVTQPPSIPPPVVNQPPSIPPPVVNQPPPIPPPVVNQPPPIPPPVVKQSPPTPPPTTDADRIAASRPMPEPTVKAVQARLKVLGYYVGKTDGLAGPQTRSAIATFQRDNSLLVDGEVSTELLSFANSASRRPVNVTKLSPSSDAPVKRTPRPREPIEASSSDPVGDFLKAQAVEEACATEKYVYRGQGYEECRAAAIRSQRNNR